MNLRPRFLIDENLSVQLPPLIQERGYEASHVRDLGLLSEKDWDLLERIRKEDWTLVTNNIVEFRDRYRRKVDLHAGVVFLAGGVGFKAQMALMLAAIDDIDRDCDLLNMEILVEVEGSGHKVSRFPLP